MDKDEAEQANGQELSRPEFEAIHGDPDGPPVMYKAIVHPDPKRSFAAVAVVAMDPSRLDFTLVAGTAEPESITVPKDHRPGLIPQNSTRRPDATTSGTVSVRAASNSARVGRKGGFSDDTTSFPTG